MKSNLLRFMTVMLLALSASIAAFAQGTTSTIAGSVTDQNGAVISGASVTVKNNGTGAEFKVSSSGSGAYSVPSLGSGVYTVTVEAKGFKKAVVQDVKLDVGVPSTVNVTLEIGAASESVVVQGGGEVLQTQSANISTTISGRQITELPFTSRDALDLVLTLPGTTTPGRPRTSTINGLPKSAINITIDGVNVQDNLGKSGDGFFTYIRPRTDAIEEVTVSTSNPGAESAAEGAVQIKFVTKSGTNQFHGGIYEYHRNPWLNSNYWFNNRDLRAPAGVANFKAPRDRVLLNQYGGKLGGPVRIPKLFDGRDKLFFFFNYEEYRLPEQSSRVRTIMHPRTQQGFFRWVAGGQIREANLYQLAAAQGLISTADPTVSKLLAEIRTAASSTGSIEVIEDPAIVTNPNTQRYTFTNSGNQSRYFPTVRFDLNLTEKHRLENTWNYQYFTGTVDFLNGTDPAFPNFPNQGFQGSNRFSNALALRSTLKSNIVNEARFSLNGGTVLFFPNVNAGQFANQGGWNLGIGAAGITSATVSTGSSRRNAPVWQFNDTLTWTRGSHSINLGASFTQVNFWQKAETAVRSLTFGVDANDNVETRMFGNTAFNTASFPGANATDISRARGIFATLVGSITNISGFAALNEETLKYSFFGPTIQRARQRETGFFASDSWRVNSNLTLSGGLRWEVQFPLIAQNGIYAGSTLDGLFGVSGAGNQFKPGTLTGSAPAYFPFNEGEHFHNTDYSNWAPSLGFAWSPKFENSLLKKITGEGGQSVFRGGYSIAYNREGIGQYTIFNGNPGLTIDASRSVGLSNLVPTPLSTNLPLLLRQSDKLGAPSFLDSPNYNNLGNINNAMRAFEPNLKVPYVQSWSFGWQRELNKDTAVEARYVGNRGLRFLQDYDINEFNIVENGYLAEFQLAQANLIANQAAGRGNTFAYFGPNTGTAPLPIHLAYFSGLGGADVNNAARYNSAQFTNLTNLNTLSHLQTSVYGLAGVLDNNVTFRTNAARAGLPVNFFRANPDRRGGATYRGNGGGSYYNALQLEFRRRLSQGLLVQSSYTFSKTNSLYRLSARAPEWVKGGNGLGITHGFKTNWIWELPFGRNRWIGGNAGKVLDRAIGGWEFHGIARIQSGAPNAIDGVRLVGMTLKDLQKDMKLRFDDANGIIYFLPQDVIDNTIKAFNTDIRNNRNTTLNGYSTNFGAPTGRHFAPAGSANCIQVYSDQCAPLRVILFGPMFTRYDLSIVKKTKIKERVDFEFRAEFLNAFNHINFMIGNPANDFTGIGGFNTTTFGRLGQAYRDLSTTNDPGGRLIQLVGRINF
ncbi:MAG: carboxypeptidase regulatory-like domain-containing protein [Acidobacteriota bacterium]|nr:carboxypeptidase regulatory-like domain-containing protein [Acidobacteriota bacterium]